MNILPSRLRQVQWFRPVPRRCPVQIFVRTQTIPTRVFMAFFTPSKQMAG
jgi:hypothetical protein